MSNSRAIQVCPLQLQCQLRQEIQTLDHFPYLRVYMYRFVMSGHIPLNTLYHIIQTVKIKGLFGIIGS